MKLTNDRDVRDRAVSRGMDSLTDTELLSLLLPATKGEESVDVAERLLGEAGSLGALSRLPLSSLRQMQGLGIERAMRLASAFELSRRVLVDEGMEQSVIRSPEDVAALFVPLIAHLDHEEMWILYLSSSNRIIERRRISVGGSSALTTDCKLIIRHALNLVASSLVVVHNHPSGVAQPSAEDLRFTDRISEAAALFDITLLDHIIISRGGSHYSFRSEGTLHPPTDKR